MAEFPSGRCCEQMGASAQFSAGLEQGQAEGSVDPFASSHGIALLTPCCFAARHFYFSIGFRKQDRL